MSRIHDLQKEEVRKVLAEYGYERYAEQFAAMAGITLEAMVDTVSERAPMTMEERQKTSLAMATKILAQCIVACVNTIADMEAKDPERFRELSLEAKAEKAQLEGSKPNLNTPAMREALKKVAEAMGVPEDHVGIAATHEEAMEKAKELLARKASSQQRPN